MKRLHARNVINGLLIGGSVGAGFALVETMRYTGQSNARLRARRIHLKVRTDALTCR
ncbi:PrsW family glutamic-type intramembrane protease [Bifidobacterium bohemicum]|uniref:PrsW family glutamic-type intramembrane protease n=1 Tax=Bifidobacterium bohemicum TaxID=638617 RepID=UPI001177DCA9